MLKSVVYNIFEILPKESMIAFMSMLVGAGTTAILWRYRKSGEVVYLILSNFLLQSGLLPAGWSLCR
jgi:hypothetical protein